MKSVTGPDSSKAIIDEATVTYLESLASQPTQSSLASVLWSTRQVRVVRGGSVDGAPLGTEILAVTDAPDTLEEFRRSLQIRDGGHGHCMCHGDPTLLLSNQDGDLIAVLGVHHGVAIRWHQWTDDAEVVDGQRLLRWLADLGVAYPMEEFEGSRRRRLESQAQAERWRAAIPPPLASYPVFDFQLTLNPAPLVPALESAFPEPRARALVLFDWFGRGAGPWSGFPAYEQLPEQLLLAMPMDCLVDALHSEHLSNTQLEGAARLFAGWSFRKTRERDLERLTAPDKQRLLDQAMRSTDLDKHARAISTFKVIG